jgi:hypothetical protein
MRTLLALAVVLLPAVAAGQAAAPAERPLAVFAAQRVAVTPVQFWRPDSAGWSASVDGEALRATLDSALTREFRTRGMGARWAFAGDVVRSARRNPTLRSDPTALGAGRWRGEQPPKPGDPVPALVADNLRTVTALGDTRYALIPVEVRGVGELAVLRVVIADTRMRTVTWVADLSAAGGADAAARLAARLADLAVDP